MMRLPNILITGTPGTGKSTISNVLMHSLRRNSYQYEVLNLSEAIKIHHLYKEWDDDFNVPIYDYNLTRKYIKRYKKKKNAIFDFHSSVIFNVEDVDLIIILHASTSNLYARLENRGYPEKKITENIESEIFQIIEDETLEKFKNLVAIHSFHTNSINSSLKIIKFVREFIIKFIKNQKLK